MPEAIVEARFTTPIQGSSSFALLQVEETDNEWGQEEEKEWEKAREALGRRSREIGKLVHMWCTLLPPPFSAFKATKGCSRVHIFSISYISLSGPSIPS